MTTVSRVARGVASLVLLVAILVGPPLALASLVGWPLPTSLPDLAGLERAARTGISDELIVDLLAVIAWLSWAQIAVAVVAELIAVLRRRPAIRLPVFPGAQTAAARLVAGVTMMTASFHSAPAAAAPAPLSVPLPAALEYVAVVEQAGELPGHLQRANAEPPAATASAAPGPTVTVQRHDSYWAVAERCLGDGFRWREVRDLNVGRTMVDGHVITAGSDLVRPGWVLHLPAGARPGAADRTSAGADASPTAEPHADSEAAITVEPGDNFWMLAEQQLADQLGRAPSDVEVHPHWQRLVDTNRDRLVQPGNPDLILPGQQLIRPVDGRFPAPEADAPPADPVEPSVASPATPTVPEVPATTAPPESTTTTTSTTTPVAEASDDVVEPPSTSSIDEPEGSGSSDVPAIVAITGIASAALAVGAKRALQRRRRRLALAYPGSAPRSTSEDEKELHRQLVANADEGTIDDLLLVLGQLAADLAAAETKARPRIVQHSPDHLELFLDNLATVAPDGWDVEADGAVWTKRPDALRLEPEAVRCPAPLLITLGEPDDGGQLYLDLEAEGTVALTGAPDVARNVARAMVTELALTPLADTLQVIVVGALTDPTVTRLDHVTVAEDWDEVAEDLIAWAEQSNAALVANHWRNGFVARGANPDHDALGPVVAVSSEPPPSHLLEALRGHRPSTVAVVTCAEVVGPATVIDCQPDRLALPELGLSCTPHPMEPDELESLVKLLDDADQPETEQPTLIPGTDRGMGTEDDPSGLTDPEYDVLVRLLGEILVEGGDPLMPKHTAVVAYIALRGTVTAERLEEAVWASPAASRKRLANTMSEARAAIGRRHLPASADGRYSRGPGLITDIDLFDQRVRRAADQPAAEAVEMLRSALDLVTGRPFSYRNADRFSYTWVDVENLQSTWDLKVAAVAQHCAELYLDLGDTDGAVAVALHALEAVPTHSGLTETLMRAHAANGDRGAVQTVYQSHAAALQKLDLDEVAVSTADLYERLSRAKTG